MIILKIHAFVNLVILFWYIGSSIEEKNTEEKNIEIVNGILIMLFGWLFMLKIMVKRFKR